MLITDAMRREADYWAKRKPGASAEMILLAAQLAAISLEQPLSRSLIRKVAQGPTEDQPIDWLCGNGAFLRAMKAKGRKDNEVSDDEAREPKKRGRPRTGESWFEEAKRVVARWQEFQPITYVEFAQQENLTPETVRRYVNVMTGLPPHVLMLLEAGRIDVETALAIAVRDHYTDEEKIGLALRVVEGKVPPKVSKKQKYESRARALFTAYDEWEPDTRRMFLTDGSLSYEEAVEQDKHAKTAVRRRRAGAKAARNRAEAVPESAFSHDIAARIAAMTRDLVQLRATLRSTTPDVAPSILRNTHKMMEILGTILEMGGERNPLADDAAPTVVEGNVRPAMLILEGSIIDRTG